MDRTYTYIYHTLKVGKVLEDFLLISNWFINWGHNHNESVGSGCASVGRAVSSNTIDPRFESSERQNFGFLKKDVNKQLIVGT